MQKPKIFTILLFLFATFTATSQPQLWQDDDWFQGQKKEYQRWLDTTGLGQTLYVHSLKADTMIVLFLGFNKEHPDTAVSAWRALSNQYRTQEGASLETLLFRRAAGCFDIDDDHLAIKIFDTYDGNKDYCFKRKIMSIEGILTTDSTAKCKAPIKDYIPIQVGDLRPLRGNAKIAVSKRVERNKVFTLTKTFLQQRYGSKVCAGRQVITRFTVDAPNLENQEFQVFNLCDEIVKEDQPALCATLQYFGHDCNWKKNEKLTILLTYRAAGKEGFILDMSVAGHYGSGFYETEGRRGYHDMETDFAYELKAYAAQLKKDLNDYLLQKL